MIVDIEKSFAYPMFYSLFQECISCLMLITIPKLKQLTFMNKLIINFSFSPSLLQKKKIRNKAPFLISILTRGTLQVSASTGDLSCYLVLIINPLFTLSAESIPVLPFSLCCSTILPSSKFSLHLSLRPSRKS